MNGHPQRFPRINCCIPFCRRGTTTFEPGVTMICGRCWRSSPLRLRRRHAQIKRLLKRAGEWNYERDFPASLRGATLHHRSFERIRAAITTQGCP